MQYYSTNGKAPIADLHKAVVKGLAEDRGLYMPESINVSNKQKLTSDTQCDKVFIMINGLSLTT